MKVFLIDNRSQMISSLELKGPHDVFRGILKDIFDGRRLQVSLTSGMRPQIGQFYARQPPEIIFLER